MNVKLRYIMRSVSEYNASTGAGLMKKFAITVCWLVFGGFISLPSAKAQTAQITKRMRAKPRSFTDNLSYFYWSDLRTGTLDSDVRGQTPDTSFYNMFNARYTVNENHRFNFQIRFELSDQIDHHEDRFDEDDSRFLYQFLFYKNASTTIRGTAAFQLPTSESSQADEDRLFRLKPNLIVSHKIDDYNSILFVPSYTRDIYSRSQGFGSTNSRFYLGTWVAYSNKYLSDKYVLRADLETKHIHMAGQDDLALKTTSFKFLLGVDCDLAGTSVYPYLVQNTLGKLASDQLGGGFQIFRSF